MQPLVKTKVIQKVHINQIQAGDTIIHQDKEVTICKNNITRSEVLGRALFGDCYCLGYKLVELVRFIE